MATARRLIFFQFLKASIADLITLLFSSLQNFEGSGDGDSGDSCADPCHFFLPDLFFITRKSIGIYDNTLMINYS
jgi:hypothetical protein